MKFIKLLIISVLLWACSNLKTSRIEQLAGLYKLYIIENIDSTGQWQQQDWGKGGDGYIVYDGKGHMAVQIIPKGYKDFQWLDEESSINKDMVKQKTDSMTTDELKEAVKEFSSSYVYVANYTIEDTADIVVHQRITSSLPVVWGTTVRRAFKFSGDTLILRVINGNRRLKWIKQK
ncbi:MAG: lipocalin-like domain-containing protein [Bacteroidetes bacterium]|nr:MAG: lipocalin-like domain-containing protein [Bacteroidota bacterium]